MKKNKDKLGDSSVHCFSGLFLVMRTYGARRMCLLKKILNFKEKSDEVLPRLSKDKNSTIFTKDSRSFRVGRSR